MKQYNPDIYHRHSIRLKGYDYSQEGLYFITICTQNHKHLFGEIKNVPHIGTVGAGSACPESNINIPQMILNPYGEIIQQCYWDLEHKYPNIECCEYVIMPNHFHAIIKIDRDAFGAGEPRPYVVTLGHIVGYFKYQSTKMINLHGQKLWQRNYYEHIIRDEKAYHNISNYILNNPAQWAYDRLR